MNDLVTWNFADKRPIDDVVFGEFTRRTHQNLVTTSASISGA